MSYEDKNFCGSLVLDFGIWWRHVKTIYIQFPLFVSSKPRCQAEIYISKVVQWTKQHPEAADLEAETASLYPQICQK